jgi:hypothetical protein
MPTGAVSGLLVVDIDAKSETEALTLVEELRRQIGGRLPACWMVKTPRGGLHLYFAMPPGAELGNRVSMIATLAGKIDVRGDGGYVILPLSRRFGAQARKEGCDGVAYAWSEECGIGDIDPPETPRGLLDLIVEKHAPTVGAPSADTTTLSRFAKSTPRDGGELADRHRLRRGAHHRKRQVRQVWPHAGHTDRQRHGRCKNANRRTPSPTLSWRTAHGWCYNACR